MLVAVPVPVLVVDAVYVLVAVDVAVPVAVIVGHTCLMETIAEMAKPEHTPEGTQPPSYSWHDTQKAQTKQASS